jgi:Type IV secretory pathway, TrbF components
MKKQIRLLIALIVIALVIGGLTYASARYSITSATDAIDAIGKVSFSDESRRLIDEADEKLAALDPNLHLTEKIENIESLQAAKVTYVEQAIIRMYRAVRDKQDESVIKEYLADVEEAFDHYLTEEDIPLIHNYQDLIDAREKYGDKTDQQQFKDLREIVPSSTVPDLC